MVFWSGQSSRDFEISSAEIDASGSPSKPARMARPSESRNGAPLPNGCGMGLVRGSYRGALMVSHSSSLLCAFATRAEVMASEDGRLRVTSMPAIFEVKRAATGTAATILMESGRVRRIGLLRRSFGCCGSRHSAATARSDASYV